MCEEGIVNDLVYIDPVLKDTYEVYQSLLHAIKQKNLQALQRVLNDYDQYSNLSKYMKTALKTLKKHYQHIANTIKTDYNNGVLEGTINKIKLIKRVSYGYKSFFHLKNRIMMIHGKGRIKKVA